MFCRFVVASNVCLLILTIVILCVLLVMFLNVLGNLFQFVYEEIAQRE
jgi:hypothetical protein